jgi:hypothetical protein
MKLRIAVLIALSSLVFGCVGVDVTRLEGASAASAAGTNVSPEDVRIFFSEAEVPGPYTRVALLRAHGDAGLTNQENLISALRKKTAALGANGLLLVGFHSDRGPILNEDRAAQAVAIRY